MKRLIKLTAALLVLILFIQILPMTVIAEEVTNGAELETVEEEPTILGEIVEERTENSKRFLMSDKTVAYALYADPVHYEQDGEMKDIDNTLSLEKAENDEDIEGYANNDNIIKVKFAKNTNAKKLLKIEQDGYKISWSLLNKNKKNKSGKISNPKPKAYSLEPHDNENSNAKFTAEKTSSGIKYTDILPNTDIEYYINGTSVKENIIVNSSQQEYIYEFELQHNGLTPVLEENGSISLLNAETQEDVFTIPAPYMYDASGEYSNGVWYDIQSKNKNKTVITITADSEWINDEATVFPVTIDPMVMSSQKRTDVASTFSAKKYN